MMKNIFSNTKQFSLPFAGMVVTALLLSSCSDNNKLPGYEYMPDMYRSPSYETNSSNPNFKDGMTDRKPVAGTIPAGFTHFPYPNTKEGYDAAGTEWKMPAEMNTPENLTEGKRLYESYCVHCHGSEGDANGPVVDHGFPPPPSYAKGNSSRGGKMKDLSDGKIYHTIQYGINLMGSHASQLSNSERWKIIMYVHELQKMGADSTATASADSSAKSTAMAETAVAKVTKTKKKTTK